MRQIVLDTETTGLDPQEGHRIIEIGCVEIVDRVATGNNFHRYLQPDREIDADAVAVHGISNEMLREQPRFAEVAEELLAYLAGAELVIHNAAFDIGFLDHELRLWRAGCPPLQDHCSVTDTLIMARRLHPGQRNSLDALCKRYGIDNARRSLHGALLDAEILADVYLAMTGGQASLLFDAPQDDGASSDAARRMAEDIDLSNRPPLRVVRATESELLAHEARLRAIDEASGGRCLWVGPPSLRAGNG
jgi:DNA polymerase-3 subunit epsilon